MKKVNKINTIFNIIMWGVALCAAIAVPVLCHLGYGSWAVESLLGCLVATWVALDWTLVDEG